MPWTITECHPRSTLLSQIVGHLAHKHAILSVIGRAGKQESKFVSCNVTLRIVWHRILLDIWHNRPSSPSPSQATLNPISGPAVFDRPARRFRKLGIGCDGSSFIVKDPSRGVPEELINREADPARIIFLRSKGFVESILAHLRSL